MRHQEQRLARQRPQAEIAAFFDVQHLQLTLEQIDHRQEILALQTMRVKIVGRNVGSCHQHHAALEQRGDQPSQYHRIRDIVDMKLVQAQHPGGFGDVVRQRDQRIGLAGQRLHLLVHLCHEIVKVDAALAAIRQAGIERVH